MHKTKKINPSKKDHRNRRLDESGERDADRTGSSVSSSAFSASIRLELLAFLVYAMLSLSLQTLVRHPARVRGRWLAAVAFARHEWKCPVSFQSVALGLLVATFALRPHLFGSAKSCMWLQNHPSLRPRHHIVPWFTSGSILDCLEMLCCCSAAYWRLDKVDRTKWMRRAESSC